MLRAMIDFVLQFWKLCPFVWKEHNIIRLDLNRWSTVIVFMLEFAALFFYKANDLSMFVDID